MTVNTVQMCQFVYSVFCWGSRLYFNTDST